MPFRLTLSVGPSKEMGGYARQRKKTLTLERIEQTINDKFSSLLKPALLEQCIKSVKKKTHSVTIRHL